MSSVVPPARSLGNKALYETLFRSVFAAGGSVLVRDLRSYCLATQYRAGSHIDAALQLLLNLGVVTANGDQLQPDEGFCRVIRNDDLGLTLAIRLIDGLVAAKEIENIFPVGALSWGRRDGELNLHLSQVPMRGLPVIKLLRDLGAVSDSDDGAVLLKVREPFSRRLQEAVTLAFSRRVRKVLSPEQLERLQEAQARQGAEAEEYVLQFERSRLEGHAQLSFVRRISTTNTAAGYDIESFEGLKSFLPDKFIEVKSYRGTVHFFWSVGELEAARELGDRYYIYVVDVEKYASREYIPQIIRNPATELFSQETDWLSNAITFEIVRKTPQEHR
jgi:Domain of unknown function (DUF3883)